MSSEQPHYSQALDKPKTQCLKNDSALLLHGNHLPTLPVRTLLIASLFLETLAYTLYTRVSSTDYEALVLAVKTAGQELYPKIPHQTVSTTRTKPVWRAEYSERDPWTATLSQSEDGLVSMEVGGEEDEGGGVEGAGEGYWRED
jgi:hypothetical protein